jgi:hypothetical protein
VDASNKVNYQEMEEALERVREYFSGREINENTILAAFLRSEGLPASGQPWQRAKDALARGASLEEAVHAAASGGDSDDLPSPLIASDVATPFVGTSLGWFPKRFGPGDLDGVGARRLLGTPDLETADVLVRETAQNSWDARDVSAEVDFTINLRELGAATVEVLHNRIFTGRADKTGLSDLLALDSVWALEVSDRGTVGLNGPVRNDLVVDEGEDTNFIDLVFNIGAPRDVHLGGGTYGFGKTITYVASSVGTVLLWSRCEGTSGLEYRLIGSAIGEGFDMGSHRYTGRHWWGNVIGQEERVEPVVGTLAKELGERAFAQDFEGESTGTSLLILSPDLGGNSPAETISLLKQALIWNLWPKMLVDQEGRSIMRIRLQLNGVDVEMPEVESDEFLSGHADCLRAVRAVQAHRELSTLGLALPVHVHEVRSERPQKLLGHLAVTRYPIPLGSRASSQSVALMRNQAELVVKYWERQRLDVEGFQWAGVFKPTADVDDSFALAEPPAHDDWIVKAVQDKARRRDVNVALDRIKAITEAFIRPPNAVDAIDDAPQSAAVAGDALAGLLGGILGSAPDGGGRSTGSPSGNRPRRPRVDIVFTGVGGSSTPGWTQRWIDVQLEDPNSVPQQVEVRVRVGVDGGSEDDAAVIRILGWRDPVTGGHRLGGTEFGGDDVRRFEFEARRDLAIDVDARIVEV